MKRVGTLPGGLKVVYPDEIYPKPGQSRATRYVHVTHAPNRPLRFIRDHQYRGILSLSLMTEIGAGNEVSTELAGTIAAHFPADLKLAEETALLRIVQDPQVSGGYRDDDRWRTPIVVDYETLKL